MPRRVPARSSLSSQFSERRRRLGGDGGRDAFSVSAAELVTNRPELAPFEFTDGDPAPPLGGADDGGIHQLQHRALAERVRNDLRPAALLEKEPLQQVGGAHDAAMAERKTQMGDARVEVVTETLHDRRQLPLVRLHERRIASWPTNFIRPPKSPEPPPEAESPQRSPGTVIGPDGEEYV